MIIYAFYIASYSVLIDKEEAIVLLRSLRLEIQLDLIH